MFLGLDSQRVPIWLSVDDLLTHGVILGRTGSGKTGLTVTILEEVAASGAHAIVLDPKGDLTNLALALRSPSEFAPWVESGVSPLDAYERHARGLNNFGRSMDDITGWMDLAETMIYAPGKTFGGGRALNIFPTFMPPRASDSVAMRDRAGRGVLTVLQALKQADDPYDPALVFLTQAVVLAWQAGRALPVEVWPGALTEPPAQLQTFDGMPLDDFFPKRARLKLARALIGFRRQADKWLSGDTLDLHRLAARQKPRITVCTMRHLSEEDRLFFTSVVMHRLVEFMYETSASQRLKLLCVLDEARGYLPPHPYNPPTKGPIGTLLAQGRAQGIGMLIGTQNPMDLDYKALSNVGTWFIGRLRERDCARDLAAELRNRNVDIAMLENMPQKNFLLLDKRGNHQHFDVRWCYHYLRGPLDGDELSKLSELGLVPGSRRVVTPGPVEPAIDVQIVKAEPAEAEGVIGKIIKFCRRS